RGRLLRQLRLVHHGGRGHGDPADNAVGLPAGPAGLLGRDDGKPGGAVGGPTPPPPRPPRPRGRPARTGPCWTRTAVLRPVVVRVPVPPGRNARRAHRLAKVGTAPAVE